MKNKKITIEIITFLSFFLCITLILFSNFSLKEANDNITKTITPTPTILPTYSEKNETNKKDSLELNESEIEIKIDNFADTNKLQNNQVITIEKIEKEMKVTADKLNVRSDATSTIDNIIAVLSKGDIVKVIGDCDNGWIEIEYQGKVAYTYEEYLEDIKEEETDE